MTGRSRRPSGDEGTSLAELLVVMAISSVLLLAVGTIFTTSLKLTKDVNSRTGATTDAKLAMDTAARRLRVAVRPKENADSITPMLVSASATSIKFYASVSPTGTTTAVLPTLIEYSIDATSGCFREARTPATSTTSSGQTTLTWPVSSRRSRCLVFGQVNAGGAGVFTYYAAPAATTPIALVGGQLPATSLNEVRSIALRMTVRDTALSEARPTTVETRVGLVNRITEDVTGRLG